MSRFLIALFFARPRAGLIEPYEDRLVLPIASRKLNLFDREAVSRA